MKKITLIIQKPLSNEAKTIAMSIAQDRPSIEIKGTNIRTTDDLIGDLARAGILQSTEVVIIDGVRLSDLKNFVHLFYEGSWKINPKCRRVFMMKTPQAIITCNCSEGAIYRIFDPSTTRRFKVLKALKNNKWSQLI